MTMSMFVPQVPTATTGYGYRTPFGVLLPPGSQVAAYLRSTGPQSADDPAISPNLVTTLAAALLRVRSGLGDTIFVLPGHSESVVDNTMLTNLLAGTRVIGIGQGGNAPVFRWTATGSQWIVNKADVTFAGLRLRFEGASGVVLPVDVTAADVNFASCDIEVASGAANLCTTALRLSAGADRFIFGPTNYMRGVVAGVLTDGIVVNAAVSNLKVFGNDFDFASGATTGNMRIAAAALGVRIRDNDWYNKTTGATTTTNIAVANVAAEGLVSYNSFGCGGDGSVAPAVTGIVFAGANSLIRCNQNFSTPTKNTSGLITPAVDS